MAFFENTRNKKAMAAALIVRADELEEDDDFAAAVASLTDALAVCGQEAGLKARALEKRGGLRLKLGQPEEAADDAATACNEPTTTAP